MRLQNAKHSVVHDDDKQYLNYREAAIDFRVRTIEFLENALHGPAAPRA